MKHLTSKFPYDGSLVFENPYDSTGELEIKVSRAEKTFEKLSRLTVSERCELLSSMASALKSQKEKLSMICTLEMGKLIGDSRKEIEKCVDALEFYAKNGSEFLKTEHPKSPMTRSSIRIAPSGIVLAVMPWNFPFWQVVRVLAPQILLGQPLVLKHASNVSESSKIFCQVVNSVANGLNLITPLFITSETVARVIADRRIKGVTLTGSEEAGRSVYIHAAENLKKCVLELGGSDCYLVTEKANIKHAAKECVKSRLINSGQSCIAAKRFIVHHSVYDSFLAELSSEIQNRVYGDPRDEQTTFAPLALENARKELGEMIRKSQDEDANIRVKKISLTDEEKSAYAMNPVIVTGVGEEASVFQNETFGPVFAVTRATSNLHMVALGNANRFGLGAAIFSEDEDEVLSMINQIDCGTIAVNEIVQSHPTLPFGGQKASGVGRELSHYAVREFANIQTVYGSLAPTVRT